MGAVEERARVRVPRERGSSKEGARSGKYTLQPC